MDQSHALNKARYCWRLASLVIFNAPLFTYGCAMQAAPAATAPSGVSTSATALLIVPFDEDGSAHRVLSDASNQLQVQMMKTGHLAKQFAHPMGHLKAASKVPELCASTSGTGGVVIGSFQYDQSRNKNAPHFIPYVSMVAAVTGVDKTTPTRVHLSLSLFQCDGKLSWTAHVVGGSTSNGNNEQAAITRAFSDAANRAISEFAAHVPYFGDIKQAT